MEIQRVALAGVNGRNDYRISAFVDKADMTKERFVQNAVDQLGVQ